MNKTTNRRNNTLYTLYTKMFKSEMATSRLVKQMTLAAFLIGIAAVIERFVMIRLGPLEVCFGFFVILLLPLLIDFRIAVLAAISSIAITELAISGEWTFWTQYPAIIVAFPIIKLFTINQNKYLHIAGLIIGGVAYMVVQFVFIGLVVDEGYQVLFLASKGVQVLVASILAGLLYTPIKKVFPTDVDNSWEQKVCCDECKPSVNKKQECCDDDCEEH